MGLEEVVREILAAGSREAAAKIEAAQRERAALLEQSRTDSAALLASREREAKADGQRRQVMDLARAELESKRLLLNSQRELLDEVYASALAALPTLPDREALTRRLLARSAADWRAGRVRCSPRDESLVRSIVGGSFAGTFECTGGVAIESADGLRRVDLTFETILRDVWADAVREVAHILWPP